MATLQERVAERYPSLLPLLNHPEIGALLRKAVNPNAPMSPGVFQSKLMATRWFRTQSESQRRWWVTRATDPGEAKLQRNNYSAEIIKTASSLGLKLTSPQVRYITESGLARGDDPGSARVMANLLAFGRKTGQVGPGSYKTAIGAVRAIGTGQWMRETPTREAEYWGAEIALGRKTIEDFQQASRTNAEHRFPHMLPQLRAGQTVSDIIGPMVEAYAREMDWDPNGLMSKMYKNPKFAGLAGIKDPKTGKVRLPTEYEARTMARQRSDWAQTTGGRETYAAMGNSLLRAFGKRA